jgi:hypothetical protein
MRKFWEFGLVGLAAVLISWGLVANLPVALQRQVSTSSSSANKAKLVLNQASEINKYYIARLNGGFEVGTKTCTTFWDYDMEYSVQVIYLSGNSQCSDRVDTQDVKIQLQVMSAGSSDWQTVKEDEISCNYCSRMVLPKDEERYEYYPAPDAVVRLQVIHFACDGECTEDSKVLGPWVF